MKILEKSVETVEKELVVISKEVKAQVKQANDIIVKTEEDVIKATGLLGEVKVKIKEVKSVKDVILTPFKEHIKFLNGLFTAQLDPLEEIEGIIKGKIVGFAREQEAIAKVKEEKLRLAKEKKDAKAIENNKPVEVAPIPTVERREQTVNVGSTQATTKKTWEFEIENFEELPKDIIAEVLAKAKVKGIYDIVVRKRVSSGVREIKGVRIFEDFNVSVRV